MAVLGAALMSLAETIGSRSAPKLRYDAAEVLLFDPVSTNRSATRGALATIGFRKIQAAYELQDVVFRLKASVVDLLILEARPDPKAVFQLVQDIRQGRLGPNPFCVIIVTAWTLDDEIVRGVVSSGADDLMRRPFSIGFLGSRVKQLIDARKEFVITAEYVGPDRRKDGGRGTGHTHAVPHTLRSRMSETADPHAVDTEILSALSKGRQVLHVEKSRRNAFQIIVLSRMMQDLMETSVPTERLHQDLGKAEMLALEIVRRLEATEFASVLQMCEPISQAAGAAKRGEDVAQNLKMIGQIAGTLYLTLSSGKDQDDLDFELTQALMAIRARGRRDSTPT